MEEYELSFFWFCFWMFLIEYLLVTWLFGIAFFRASWKSYVAERTAKKWDVDRTCLLPMAAAVIFTPIIWPLLLLIRLIGGAPPVVDRKE